jgi:hypothetical protein
VDFVPLSMNGTKHQQLSFWSSHNETAASAWQQQNADWLSEMKKANHNTHHPENSPTHSCGTMDTDDEAA